MGISYYMCCKLKKKPRNLAAVVAGGKAVVDGVVEVATESSKAVVHTMQRSGLAPVDVSSDALIPADDNSNASRRSSVSPRGPRSPKKKKPKKVVLEILQGMAEVFENQRKST